ncbi:IclR family transcriptional regulator [Paenibacillus sp. GCM10027626]|uniref:IclR family transcriptional regulator n=1 Tax=Paenibacillus sp. GCM10027626 TaxID=3273411 RepID=UPI003634BD56
MVEQNKPSATVKSADRVLDIFELFASEQEPMNLVEIARKLDMPVSSTYKILQNLLMRGYLETDKNEKMFKLGYKILEIATRYVQNTDLITEFHYISQKIVDDINEAVFLSIRNEDKILYVAEKQSTHPVRFVSHRGMKLPLHSTAMGKALLSSLETEEITALYPNEEMGKLTDSTVTDRSTLLKQLELIRADGLAYSYGESVQGIQCVAAPIFNSEGKAVASMSISIPSSRLNDELWQRAIDAVKQGAKELSLNLYHQGDDRL